MRKIYNLEPWFFIFFGIFYLHRIWALIDRESYASFWLGIMRSKGLLYFLLMGILSVLCILGIVTYIKERGKNYWWRTFHITTTWIRKDDSWKVVFNMDQRNA